MNWHILPDPVGLMAGDRERWKSLLPLLEEGVGPEAIASELDQEPCLQVETALRVLADLSCQGWAIRQGLDLRTEVSPPARVADARCEKQRVRDQELIKRDEQLRKPSVRRFITRMETPREFGGRLVSIFDLMRDGKELAGSLRRVAHASASPTTLRDVINPYVQVVDFAERDAYTGLRLGDVWRYFRHTWSNQYTTVPGRTMMLLVRDRAVPSHPVFGIAALSSAVIQIDERDRWLRWRPADVLQSLTEDPTTEAACWLVDCLNRRRHETYVDDLVADDLYWPGLWSNPDTDAIAALRAEGVARRADHQRFPQRAKTKRIDRDDPKYWTLRAETDLFRSKRCQVLADLLRDKAALDPYMQPVPTGRGLRRTLDNREGRRAIRAIARRAKAETVGTEIADLSVCGSLPPYNALVGGKLVAMLAMSPSVVRAYHDRYGDYESEIASSLAGRAISRNSRLVYVGTTSLYEIASAQYNRVVIPADILDAKRDVRLRRLGKSRSFGTSHLSADTVTALTRLSIQSRNGARVNSMFGEGVNPKLRKVREGLDALGWPSDKLLQHGRRRIVYGAAFIDNLLPYLLGMHSLPKYIFPTDKRDDVECISLHWIERWLIRRAQMDSVLSDIASHSLGQPVAHGARVPEPATVSS